MATGGRAPLRPGVRILDRIMKASPVASVARLDAAALRRMQETVIPDRSPIALLLGRRQRGVRVTVGGFDASHGARLPLRFYTPIAPRTAAPRPVVVNFHGGGFAMGSARQGDWSCSLVARNLDALVISVDYRLAPGHPFPAAVEDCYETLAWVGEHAAELGGDPARLAVMGDSAGGNLAAVVAIMAREQGGPAIAHQALLYPVTDMTEALLQHQSYVDNDHGIVLSHADMAVYNGYYAGAAADTRDWRLSPLYAADLAGLPPALVVVAGLDPLHDCGIAYAKALSDAGVPVSVADYADMPHGFLSFPYLCKQARPAMAAVVTAQRAALRAAGAP
jgi:acetyl esterase